MNYWNIFVHFTHFETSPKACRWSKSAKKRTIKINEGKKIHSKEYVTVLEIFYVEESSNLIGWETFRSINEEQVLSFTCVFCRKFENYYYFYIQEKKSMHERIKFLIFFPNLGTYWELFEPFWPAWIIFQKKLCVFYDFIYLQLYA